MALMFAPILFVIVIIFVAYPFLAEKSESADRSDTSRDEHWQALLAEKEDAIATLKDIDMDYRMGKLSEEDYHTLKIQHEQHAVEVIKRFEAAEKAQKKSRS